MAAIDLYFPNLQAGEGPGGWGAYRPPEPTPPSEATQPGAAGEGPGGWGAYTGPEPPKVQREMGPGEAAMRSSLRGMSMDTYPAMAGAASGINALLQGQEYLPAYTQTRQQELESEKQAQAQYPWLSAGAELGGAALPMVVAPYVSGALGVGRAIGEIAPTVAGRIWGGTKAGGLYGTITGGGEQVSEGASPEDIAKGAAGGGVAGGILGTLGTAAIEGATTLGKGVWGLIRGARDAETEAGSKAVTAMQQGKDSLHRIIADKVGMQAADEAGTPLTLVDLFGENTRALLRAAGNISPQARDTIMERLAGRTGMQQTNRIRNWISNNFHAGDKTIDTETLKQVARSVNGPAYERAYAQGDRDIMNPALERLTSAPTVKKAITSAIENWRDWQVADKFGGMNPGYRVVDGNLVKGPGLTTAAPNIQMWDYIVRELNRGAEYGSPNGRLAGLIKEELDKLVPAYKQAREGAASFFGAQDLLDAGAKFISNRTAAVSNIQGARAVAKMNPADLALFQRGAATELIARVQDNPFLLNSIFRPGSVALQRIRIAFGNDAADRLEGLLRMEGLVARTQRIMGGSDTIPKGMDVAAWGGTGSALMSEGLSPFKIMAAGLLIAGRQIVGGINKDVANRVAGMLTSTDPNVVDKGYRVVMASPKMRQLVQRASNLSGQQIISYFGPAGVAALGATAAQQLRRPQEEMPKGYPNVDQGQEDTYSDHGARSP